MSGNISARTGSQTPSSKTTTPSSTPPAPPGETSSPSLKPSPPSECANGLTSVSRYDLWYHVSDPPLESVEGLWRDAPLAPVIRDAEPKKLSLLRSRHRALRLVDLEPQLVGQEPAHRGHDPFAGAPAANIDVAVVGVPAKAVTASGQFFVEAVKHEIA